MRWVVPSIVLACGFASAQDERHAERLARYERNVASVDTRVRLEALSELRKLDDASARRRLYIVLTRDPEPAVRMGAFQCALLWAQGPEATAAIVSALDEPDLKIRDAVTHAASRLRDEDLRRIPVERITALLADAHRDEPIVRAGILSIIGRQIDAGVAVSTTALLAAALDARSFTGCDAFLACADRATTVAPLTSADTPLLVKLLAREHTREKTIGLLARARGSVAWGLLLEVEATTSDADERDRAHAALERHGGRVKEFRTVLEEAAKNAKDPRVRERAQRWLDGS